MGMSKPVATETLITTQPLGDLVPRRVSGGHTALAAGGSLGALAGAAFGVAALAIMLLMPALVQAMNDRRVRVEEPVARAMLLETLIAQRKQSGNPITAKARRLQNANGHLADFRRPLGANRKDRDQADVARWGNDLQVGNDAFARAQTHLTDLKIDLTEFDRQIQNARIDTQLAHAGGNVASALPQANLSAEDRHVTERALSEIARRAGRNTELFDQALTAGQGSRRAGRGSAP